MLRSLLIPKDNLRVLAQKRLVWSALIIGAGGFYWRTLNLSERLLPPQLFDVTFVFFNVIAALAYLALVSLLVQASFRLCGHSVKDKLHPIFFLWGWTELPRMMLILGVFYLNYFIPGFIIAMLFNWWWMAVTGAVLVVFCVWYLLLKLEALKICYGVTGAKLFAPVALIVFLCGTFNLVLLNTLESTAWIKLTDLKPMLSTLDLKMVKKSTESPILVDPYIPIPTVPVDGQEYRFHRGDIVSYVLPGESDRCSFPQKFCFQPRRIGRIIGLPGETLELVKSWIKIDGEALIEPYVTHKQNYDYAPTTIPPQHFFVVGDNRLMHFSKYRGGLIKQEDIKGICTSVSGITLKLFAPKEEEQQPLQFQEERPQGKPSGDKTKGKNQQRVDTSSDSE
jgi:signal peptidase I